VITGSAGRRQQLGLDEAQVSQAREVAEAVLVEDGKPTRGLRRADLFGHWDAAGLATTGQRGVYLLSYLAMTGVLVLGPMPGTEQHVVLTETWIPRARSLGREEALGELAERYFRSHGPATVSDLTRWAKLVATDARTAVAVARPRLATFEEDGVEHLMDPATPDLLRAAAAEADTVILLPGFDELLLGYGDRRAVLDPAYAERIVPGGNGMFRPTVIVAGQVVGTWCHAGSKTRRSIEATPFTAFTPAVEAVIPLVYAALP
jgi:hypothetical protein